MNILDKKGLAAALTRLAAEIVKRNSSAKMISLVGIRTRGEFLARRLEKLIVAKSKKPVELGFLDITLYRDDLRGKLHQPILKQTEISFDINGKTVVLVDDVLFTGRTVRAALEALSDLGRASSIHLAVLIDRGHRELPVMPDFVGKIIKTTPSEDVQVRLVECDGTDSVVIAGRGKKKS
ncbi:MAG TPA: bifunctional pyr operon transcriptional regulator/uracil phosphoribosyltransferase PyrR [Bacteroidota bacterium]|nr:bifunctional pyr operon transcriptional regulator/uracil phosphoribosyltransferase PyrR [Bacteroidota bacterium]